MIRRGIEKIIVRQQWRFARTHVGEDHSRFFQAGIGAVANLIAMFAAARFARLFETAAVNVVQPAMIKATQAAVFDPAVTQIRAAVGTMNSQKSDSSLIVAKQHQIFAPKSERSKVRRPAATPRRALPAANSGESIRPPASRDQFW